VGAVSQFTIIQNRVNIRRYGINSPIEAFSVVPGPITTTLELKFGVLYVQDAMQAFAFESGNIAFQIRPLIIHEIVRAPSFNISSLLPKIGERFLSRLAGKTSLSDVPLIHSYMGCWFANSQMRYALDGDQMVIQDARLDVSRVINTNLAEYAVARGVQKLSKHLQLLPNLTQTAVETIRKGTSLFQ
jgi:hypothetical protein